MSWTEQRRVAVRGGELAVVDAGDPEAPPVLLLAGAWTGSYLWRRLIPLLSPWMRVIAPDLLGSGASSIPAAPLGLQEHARSIRELLAELGVDRFALGGHGHGGGVAQLVALDGAVDALLLVDTIAFDAWPSRRVRDLATAAPEDPAAAVHDLLMSAVARPELLQPADVETFVAPFAGPDGRERFTRIVDGFDGVGLVGSEERLATLDVPALVLWGEDDALLPADLAERLGDALPRAAVALLPGCGHLLLEDAPDTVVPMVFQWLRAAYLKVEHRHEPSGPIVVSLGRRPPGEE